MCTALCHWYSGTLTLIIKIHYIILTCTKLCLVFLLLSKFSWLVEHSLLAVMGFGSGMEDVEEELGTTQLVSESITISVLADA